MESSKDEFASEEEDELDIQSDGARTPEFRPEDILQITIDSTDVLDSTDTPAHQNQLLLTTHTPTQPKTPITSRLVDHYKATSTHTFPQQTLTHQNRQQLKLLPEHPTHRMFSYLSRDIVPAVAIRSVYQATKYRTKHHLRARIARIFIHIHTNSMVTPSFVTEYKHTYPPNGIHKEQYVAEMVAAASQHLLSVPLLKDIQSTGFQIEVQNQELGYYIYDPSEEKELLLKMSPQMSTKQWECLPDPKGNFVNNGEFECIFQLLLYLGFNNKTTSPTQHITLHKDNVSSIIRDPYSLDRLINTSINVPNDMQIPLPTNTTQPYNVMVSEPPHTNSFTYTDHPESRSITYNSNQTWTYDQASVESQPRPQPYLLRKTLLPTPQPPLPPQAPLQRPPLPNHPQHRFTYSTHQGTPTITQETYHHPRHPQPTPQEIMPDYPEDRRTRPTTLDLRITQMLGETQPANPHGSKRTHTSQSYEERQQQGEPIVLKFTKTRDPRMEPPPTTSWDNFQRIQDRLGPPIPHKF